MKPIKKARVEGQVIIAIDPSPNGTAVVKVIGGRLDWFWFFTSKKKWLKEYSENAFLIDKVDRGNDNERMERLICIRDVVMNTIIGGQRSENLVIGMEDYVWSIPAKASGGVYQIGELGGVLRVALYEGGYRTRLYDPMSVKLAMTGRGDAKKEDMILAGTEYLEEHGTMIMNLVRGLPTEAMEGVMDAVGVASLLSTEMRLRRGEVALRDLPERVIRVVNRVTKANPTCLMDTPFLER